MSYTKSELKAQHENFIGGERIVPVDGQYFETTSPINNKQMTMAARQHKKISKCSANIS